MIIAPFQGLFDRGFITRGCAPLNPGLSHFTPSAFKSPKRKKLWTWNYLFQLAHEDAAWVGGFAAVEFKQQIQSWDAKGFNMGAAAWACAGKYVCNAIAITIVDCNARTACEVFCVGIKLGK